MKPLILINLKAYKEVSGEKALQLAQKIAQVRSTKYSLALSPPSLYLTSVCQKSKLEIYAQHTDPEDYGAYTGHLLAAEIKKAGAAGTILNHSEKKLPFKLLKETILSCKKVKLKTIVCASTLSEIRKISRLKPSYLAYEPKKLIGSQVSVTTSKPKIIIKALKVLRKKSSHTRFLVGAGVHSREDLGQALLLGADGVLLSHAVVKSKNPQKFLKEMLI